KMALGRRKPRARREPTFTLARPNLDLRLTSRDRPAPEAAERTARKGSGGKGKPGQSAKAERPAQRKAGSGGGGKGRGRIGRLFYWALVLALWVFIGGLGAVVWVGAHLPPIQ